ncbi:MAG: nucleoside:proton symporter [Alphaproteobacteria bacterium CG_4_10_14_0_8_um_filter_37_21]|nr:MAG: nucleoside:proton symporter [Alphaproteobacteria bacterium CG_4_10_14_0_8_um_filter_37_21]
MHLSNFQGVIGVCAIFLTIFLLSENKQKVQWRFVIQGFLIQCIIMLLITFVPAIKSSIQSASSFVMLLKDATRAGTSFVFGYLGGGDAPFILKDGAEHSLFVFAFQALPLIIVVSALSMLLFHLKVIPFIVRTLSPIFQKLFHVGGAMGVVASAKLFLSQMETPLLIRPYLTNFTRTELLMVIACGMSTTSAAAVPLYAMILGNTFDNVVPHILVASLISIPAAITLTRILIPEDGEKTQGDAIAPFNFKSSMDAISKGAIDGMSIFWNITSMLIVFAALIFLLNALVGKITLVTIGHAYSVQNILGYLIAPFTFSMGVPWSESLEAGQLLATKTILNEVFAFAELSKSTLSDHSKKIMLYALCGFANFSSVGMVIGSLGTLVPERRNDIISLAPKAVLIGTMATCLSGTLVGLLNFH